MFFSEILKKPVLQHFTGMESLLAGHKLEDLQYSHSTFTTMVLKEWKAA